MPRGADQVSYSLAFVWGTLALKVARKRRSVDKLDAEDACIA
jgi:hypothetical protein